MQDQKKTKAQLLAELAELRRRIAAWETTGHQVAEPQTPWPNSASGPSDRQEPGRLQAILTATIECFPFDFFALGPEGRYMLQNAASRQHYGDAIGQRPEDLAPDEATKRLWQGNNRRAFAGERVEEEVEAQIHGQTLHFYNIITPIRDGDAILGILGVNVDVSQRKRAEEALRVSQERAQLLLDTVRVGIYECDTDGLILWVNSAAEEITGYR